MRKEIRKTVFLLLAAAVSVLVMHSGHTEAKTEKKVTSVKINVSGKNLLINKGEKKRLRVKVRPKKVTNKKIKWKSSRKKIVSVSSKGVIRGRRYGKAYIYACAQDGSGKRAKIRVQVGRKVSRVTLAVGTLELDVNSSVPLKAKVTPSNATKKKLTYRSSDKSVATVSSTGVVYGKAKGSANITVESTDGSGRKATCKVQVKIPSQSIQLNADGQAIRLEKEKAFTINATVQPSNASNRDVKYTSSNPAVAKVSQYGIVVGVNPGTATIHVNAADGRAAAALEVEVYEMALKGEKLIAHRGYSSQAPENTTAAFELAVNNGFYGVECDLRKTLDGKFVIMHDSGINRMCGYNLDIANLDLQQLKKYEIVSGSNVASYPGLTVPTLEEYLEILSKSDTVHPFIELKEEFTSKELKNIVQTVREYGLLERAYFISIYKSNLLALKNLEGVVTEYLQYVYGAESVNKLQPVDDNVVNWCIENGIDLDARYTLISASNVSRLHDNGRKVNVWTVNTIQKAFPLVNDAHVDMITTEYMLNS